MSHGRLPPSPRRPSAALWVWTLLVGLSLGAARPASAAGDVRVRVAISDFRLVGGAEPALSLQMQDGFVIGLVRAGLQVLDPVDVARRLEKQPELVGCDSSPCLKSMGQALDVRYVITVKVEVNGNSYRMVARLFSTDGPTPPSLPIATKTTPCDVCTVAEAREVMIKLADAINAHIEEPPPPAPAVPAPIVRNAPDVFVPAGIAAAGLAVAAAGVAVLASRSTCPATPPAPGAPDVCTQNTHREYLGAALLGLGVVGIAAGTYVSVSRYHEAAMPGAPATTVVALGTQF